MQRGEIWIAQAPEHYALKPAPFVIVQSNITIPLRDSITICRVTSDISPYPLFRMLIEPNAENGLKQASSVMADKIMTMQKSYLTKSIGTLSLEQLASLDNLLALWIGL